MMPQLKTSSIDLHYIGPSLEIPAKTAFYFALSAEDSLKIHPYCYPAKLLVNQGWRIISATPPCHENGARPTEIKSLWLEKIDELNKFIDDVSNAMQELLPKLSTPIATISLSRGFIPASHLAAAHPEISYLLAFAPLTKLPNTEELNTLFLAHHMKEKHVRIHVGHNDLVIHTENVLELNSFWTNAAKEKGIENPHFDLAIKPSVGPDGHSTYRKTFEEGISWLTTQI